MQEVRGSSGTVIVVWRRSRPPSGLAWMDRRAKMAPVALHRCRRYLAMSQPSSPPSPRASAFETCSFFSPVFEFGSQAAARATADAVLQQLRSAPPPLPPVPARRRFLLGAA